MTCLMISSFGRDSMQSHFSPVCPAGPTGEPARHTDTGGTSRNELDPSPAAVGARRPPSRSDGSHRTRSVKQKGSTGVPVCDGEVSASANARQVDDLPPTRAPASPVAHTSHCTCAHRHACILLTTPRWRVLAQMGPCCQGTRPRRSAPGRESCTPSRRALVSSTTSSRWRQ